MNLFIDAGGNADAVAVYAARLHYWNLDEPDDTSTVTTRVDSAAVGTSWSLTESSGLNDVITQTGLRGGSTVAARTNPSGASCALIKTGRTASLSSTQDWTVAGWFNLNTAPSTMQLFGDRAVGALNTSAINVRFMIDSGTSLACYTRATASSDFSQNASMAFTPSSGTWYFVQARRQHSLNRISVRVNNGSWTNGTASNTNYTGGADIAIGAAFGIGTNDEIDRMDAGFQFWGYYGAALTDDQLNYLYNSGSGKTYAEIVADAS